MHLYGDQPHGTLFSACFRKLHSMSERSPKLFEEIKAFDEDLAFQLENLKPKEGSKILQLSWLSQVLTLALDKHIQAVSLIPPLDFPLLVCDEKWMNDYMDQTALMLDVCNALIRALSNVEQDHLLIRHACHILVNAENAPSTPSSEAQKHEDRLSLAHKSLREWVDLQLLNEATSQKYSPMLQDMIKDLTIPQERALVKGKGFLYALYEANTAAVFAFYMLSLAVSRESELFSLTLSISPVVSWSACILHLIQVAKDEAKEQKGPNVCLEDLGALDSSVRGLLRLIENALESEGRPLPEGAAKILDGAAHDLLVQSDQISRGLELLMDRLNEMFKAIVSSRSALLDKLGHFGIDNP